MPAPLPVNERPPAVLWQCLRGREENGEERGGNCQYGTPLAPLSSFNHLVHPAVRVPTHRHLIRQTGHWIARPLLSKLSKYILHGLPQLSLSANGQLIISEPLSHRASCLVSVTVLVTTLKHDYGIL